MNSEDNEQRLIHMLEQYRDEECLRLLDQARAEAASLLKNTHRRARRQLHLRAESERARARSRIAAARAELETRRRRHRQDLSSALLRAAHQRLSDKLAERWADPQARSRWIRSAVTQARAILPSGRWTVRHPTCFRAQDNNTLIVALNGDAPQAAALLAEPAIDAGLIIESGDVSLDASLEGLLSDRASIDARLLGLLKLPDADARAAAPTHHAGTQEGASDP